MAEPQAHIAEQDGSVVRIVAGDVEVIAEMTREADELIFERLSIDGAGPQSLGFTRLKALAREFARSQGVSRIRVRGTTRTTGANPGKIPRRSSFTYNACHVRRCLARLVARVCAQSVDGCAPPPRVFARRCVPLVIPTGRRFPDRDPVRNAGESGSVRA